jgi:hypothetical protein
MIEHLIGGFTLGVASVVAWGVYLNRRDLEIELDEITEYSPEEENIDEESYRITRILESILFADMEYDGMTIFLSRTEVEGLQAVKLVLHDFNEKTEEEFDTIHYALVDGLEVSLVTFKQWASVLGADAVRSIPCMDDLDDIEGFFDATEDDEN